MDGEFRNSLSALDHLVELRRKESVVKRIQVMDNLNDESKAEVYELIFQLI